MSIHKHLRPKKQNFKVKISEGKNDKPTHIVYGLWAAVALIVLLPNKNKGTEPGKDDIMKSYNVLMRTLGMF